ncbi:MAG: restriction endonuclease subunit S [Clostridiales bacterium]|nr:restriction endonuclease subunit S [Clostridiales bacterium]
MSWGKVTLGNISSIIQTGPFGSQLHQSDYSEEGTPVVMPKDLVNGHISEASIARVSEDHVNRLSRHKIEVGDILYSRRGDVGRCAFATELEQGWLCGTGCLRVTIDKSKAIPKFVFYQLQKAETIGWVEKHAVGATMLNLNTSILSGVPIDMPSLAEQQTVVDVLSAYDDLIENNRKQIKLLEEAAQRLYKEWFVDLRFPGHETTPIVDGVPEGWLVARADSFFGMSIGKTPPRAEKKWFTDGTTGTPWVSISDMGNSGVYVFRTSEGLTEDAILKHNIKVVPADTVLLSFKLTVGRVSITTSNSCTNEAIAHFVIKDKKLREYVYLYLKCFEYDSLGNTSSISKAVNSKIVKGMPFIMPDTTVLGQFHQVLKPIFDEINNHQKAIIHLSEARDRLLPKLMNGEIEV